MHSFADGHLGCFYVLTIVNSAGTNTEVHYTNIRKNSGNDCSQTTKKYWGKNRLHGKAKSYSDNLSILLNPIRNLLMIIPLPFLHK